MPTYFEAYPGQAAGRCPKCQLAHCPHRFVELFEADTELDERAPQEARDAVKAAETLLAQKKLPKGLRGIMQAAVRGIRQRGPVWDELQSEDDEPGDDPPKPAEESGVTEFAAWTAFEEARAEGDATIYPVKIIAPGWGNSGYYHADVLKAASKARVFSEGLRMFWNHPTQTQRKERPERDLDEMAAVLVKDAEWRETGKSGPGLYSEAKVLSKYADAVKELGPHIGLSIRALGEGKQGSAEGRKGLIIEAIHRAQSVDFVTAAGAGGAILKQFEEAAHLQEDDDMGELEEARKERDESRKELEEARRERDALARRIALTEASRNVEARVQAKHPKLPAAMRTRIAEAVVAQDPFKKGTLDLLAESELDALIKSRADAEAEYLESVGKSVRSNGRVTGMGDSDEDGGSSLEETVKEFSSVLSNSFGLNEAETKYAVGGRR